MQPGEALGISAQIAVTLAGFTGIVVAFATGAAHEWPPADHFRLRLLLIASIVPLALSLTGLMLLTTEMRAQFVWGLASGLAALLLVGSGVAITRKFRRLPVHEFRKAGGNRVVFYTASTAATAVTLLQFVNAIVLQTFWPFFVGIVIPMLICVVQFMRLVLHHPGGRLDRQL
jgi:small-conductance mechanosensitive channel